MTRHFLALGDSYTIGEAVPEAQRWPVQLAARLRDRGLAVETPQIIARTGWTTDELAAAVERAAPAGPFALVSLLIGVNNQYRGRDLDEYRAQFAALLERTIGLAGGDPRRVLVLSIPDWGVTPFAGLHDRAKIAAEIDLFNRANAEATRSQGAHYVDVTPISRQARHDRALLAPDGLHPSGAMYGAWAELALEPACAALGEK
jgi:lysophospholipase L1-like esterase